MGGGRVAASVGLVVVDRCWAVAGAGEGSGDGVALEFEAGVLGSWSQAGLARHLDGPGQRVAAEFGPAGRAGEGEAICDGVVRTRGRAVVAGSADEDVAGGAGDRGRAPEIVVPQIARVAGFLAVSPPSSLELVIETVTPGPMVTGPPMVALVRQYHVRPHLLNTTTPGPLVTTAPCAL